MNTTEYVMPLSLTCPRCRGGSSFQYEAAVGRSEWDSVQCHSCKEAFEIATAVDEMFVHGPFGGQQLWAGSHAKTYRVRCEEGKTVLIDVRGHFETVHSVEWGASGSWLAGGLVTAYLPQGYVMVALAEGPDGPVSLVDLSITVVGRRPGQDLMPAWQSLMLEARLAVRRSRRLPAILSVAAVDLFVEAFTGQKLELETGGRPGSWSALLKGATQTRLAEILETPFPDVEAAVRIRNAFAHGQDHHARLPPTLLERETTWEQRRLDYVNDLSPAPSSTFVMGRMLDVIRAIRRSSRCDTRHVAANGLFSPGPGGMAS